MTDLRKPVKRRTADACATVRRRLIVALLPGDVLAFREERRRHWVTAPLARVFITVAKCNADALRAQKRANRKRNR